MCAESAFCIFVLFIRIDRFAIFQDDVRPLHLREMVLEDFGRVIDCHWNDRAARFLSHLKAALFKWKHQLVGLVARTFRKDAHGNAVLDIVDSGKNRL